MQTKHSTLLYLLILTSYPIFNTVTHADVVETDDQIVQGNLCVGFDCTQDMDFEANTLILKENNLRIRFHDTSAPDVLGQSWNLSANSSNNGEKSYFQFELKSLTEDTIRFSDGSAPLYDCSVAVSFNTLPPVIGVIPFGDPVLTPQNAAPAGVNMVIYECLTVSDFTQKPILTLGTTADNNVTLGFDSQAENDTVSVGNSTLLRNLKHVAEGLAETDLLIKKTIDEFSTLKQQKMQIAALEAQLAMLDAQLSDVEAQVFPVGGGSGSSFSPILLLWLAIVGALLKLRAYVTGKRSH